MDVNFYVLVGFSTLKAASWAAGNIGGQFDCLVVAADAVDENATVLEVVK